MIDEKARYEKMYDRDLRDYIDKNLTEATLDIIGLESDLNDTHEELFGDNKNGNKNN